MTLKDELKPQHRYTRLYKGSSIVDDISDYTIIDIETTGLDSKVDKIIELAALKIKNNKIVGEYSQLINPEQNIDEFITTLTGINNDMVKDMPAIDSVIEKFINFVDNDIIIGHNVNFDINFIYDNVEKILNKHFSNDFIDTLRISRRCILSDNYRLGTLSKKLNIDYTGAHRALKDCHITYNLYSILKNKLNEDTELFIRNSKKKISAKDILSNINDIDENNPLFGKECIFTGTLVKMTRKEAMQIVANLGGKNRDNVTFDTNYLVLGNNDYNPILRGKKSSKLIKAEKLKLSGQDIEIISENVFYDMIEDYIQL